MNVLSLFFTFSNVSLALLRVQFFHVFFLFLASYREKKRIHCKLNYIFKYHILLQLLNLYRLKTYFYISMFIKEYYVAN